MTTGFIAKVGIALTKSFTSSWTRFLISDRIVLFIDEIRFWIVRFQLCLNSKNIKKMLVLLTFSDFIVTFFDFRLILLLLLIHLIQPLDQFLLLILFLLDKLFRILSLLLGIFNEFLEFLLILI